MAQTPVQPNWLWHQVQQVWYFHNPTIGQHFYYDQANDDLVSIETKERIPRSPLIRLPQWPASPTQQPVSPSRYDNRYTSTRSISESSNDADALVARVGGLGLNDPDYEPASSSRRSQKAPSQASHDSSLREDPPPVKGGITPAPRPVVRAGRVQPEIVIQNGVRITRAVNVGGVQTIFADQPAEEVTDPTLLQYGFRAQRKLYGTQGENEALYPSFKMQKESFWIIGRVFQILWSEPASDAATLVTSWEAGLSTGRYGESVHSKVRRFVIVRQGQKYSSVCPIATYGGQGVAKRGVTKSDHAIIFTGNEAPTAQLSERPARDEQPMRSQAIRMVPDDKYEKLDTMSRLNFGKVSTVEHNLKVRSVGVVHPKYMEALISQFHNVVMGASGGASDVLQQQRPLARSVVSGSSKVSGVSHGASTKYEDNDDQGEDDEEDEDDADDGDDNEDDEEEDEIQAGQQTPVVNRRDRIFAQLLRNGMPREQAARETTIALQFQTQYLQLVRSGYNRDQAMEQLASKLLESVADASWEDLMASVQNRLGYGN